MDIHNTEQNKEPDIKLWKMLSASKVQSYYDDKHKPSAISLKKQIQK